MRLMPWMSIRTCKVFLCLIKADLFEKSAGKLLMPQDDFTGGGAEPILRSGLYVVRSFVSSTEEQAYVLYWPEDTTWNDQAFSTVQRNRVTFMRYDCLVRSSPSQIDQIGVGISRNYAIRSFVYCRQNIHKQLCGVTRMVTMYRLIQITTTRAGSTTLWLQKQTIKKRILLSDQDSRCFFFVEHSSPTLT